MFARTYGAATLGVDGLIIDVEVDASSGLPAFDLVGLPDTAVRESKERVRTAIRNTGLRLRQEKVTVNLAPADIRKDSSGLDLPIAIGLLASYGIVPAERIRKSLFAAELSLEGECRPIRGVLPMAIQAKKEGFADFLWPKTMPMKRCWWTGFISMRWMIFISWCVFCVVKRNFLPLYRRHVPVITKC